MRRWKVNRSIVGHMALSTDRTVKNFQLFELSVSFLVKLRFLNRHVRIPSLSICVSKTCARFGYDSSEADWCEYEVSVGHLVAMNGNWIHFKSAPCPTWT